MESKLKKYIIYTKRFIQSSNKKKVIGELVSEVKNKGLVTGMRSLLHKKSHFYSGDSDEFLDPRKLSIKKYDRNRKIVLPNVANPKVSVIIPIYNQVSYTHNCVCAIYDNNDFKDYEIIIADDNSTENTDILRQSFENIVIIRNETNFGFLRNCNNAATNAKGEYLVFLNNDTQVQKDWLAELLFVFENYKDVGLVGSKLIYPNGQLQEAGGIVWQDGSAWNYGNRQHPQKPEFNYVKEVDYISGASIMIPNVLWKELGGFDERFLPAYCEDTDICFQLRDRGYKVIYQPFSVAVHFEGITHGKNVNKGIKQYQVVNQQKLIEKWAKELALKSKNGEHVFTERDRSGSKKHVLVIDHYVPRIDKDAGSRTISNFIDVLLELNYSVKFLGENASLGIHYQKRLQEKGVEVLYGSRFDFTQKSWRSYFKEHWTDFDAILMSRSSVCAPIMNYLRANNYTGNLIYYGHDLGFLRVEGEAELKHDPSLHKLAKTLKEAEDYMYSEADNSLVCGFDELGYLKGYIDKPLHYVPPYFFDIAADTAGYEQREGLLFVGGFNHPPNQDAMKWFLDEVYRPLHKTGITLTIAGSKMPKFIFDYKVRFPLLQVLPDVPAYELDELYDRTRISIAPLRSGAGVKGKVIEAMAKGVPVVGTVVAFEGMPKSNDFVYKGYDSAEEIGAAILRVYGGKDLWEKLSRFGKQYVSDNFNKENMKQVFRNIIEQQ